ncbi:MBL fold metallo-hydrolase [Flavobacterium difficile]|uniref:MBL fold metallo-hydrolase n=1 Tax=Flavobacterium difficile TaxID=2709659 RepID=A0ABX0I8T3_9FLAO|nr:MBL fold metallo-hydrolase [Flavobacterium difficile]NHM03032.1 MBL fold metallo-hydrolase [Flavobacterium difficile]
MTIFIVILVLLVASLYVFLQQEQFGKRPSGARLARIKNSPNFKNNSFQNLSFTPDLTEGVSMFSVLKEFLFNKNEFKKPSQVIPSTKTNLKELNPEENIVVWFGHSSYFIQIDGKKILVDPVLSPTASPVSFTTKAFEGTNIYTTDDFPEIDYLFISHDHWDHLDYQTIKKLKPKIQKVITGLGTGAHFEHWGFDTQLILEKDWHETVTLEDGFIVNTVPARHFSGRSFKRNKALWLSFVLQTPSFKIFIGGDSGYDTHFAEIGKQFGPFDLAFLENGQYDKSWKYIHMMPEEVLQAATDLKTKALFPVHSSKFTLANHNWEEPLSKISELAQSSEIQLITPIIGEKTDINTKKIFVKWWEFSI